MSSIPIIVLFGRNEKSDELLELVLVNSGTILISLNLSIESCVSKSKFRIDSTTSPKKSIRYGNSEEYENRSRILPR